MSEDLVKFIQSFPRSKDGYFLIGETFYSEDDKELIKLLNSMYKKEKITFSILKSILVLEQQEKEYNEAYDEFEYFNNQDDKYERMKDGY
jgi:hypothetical protein